jgi:predicted small metal-binding protein
MGDKMPEELTVKCPACESDIRATDESRLVDGLQQHLYEKHGIERPQERVRENVAAQLRDFDGYNARPISGA